MYTTMELLLPTLHTRPAVPTLSHTAAESSGAQTKSLEDGTNAATSNSEPSSLPLPIPLSLLLSAETEGVAVTTSRVEWWLERGLAQHYFSFGDRGQKMFQTAKVEAGLEVRLTAAMGKRTKHQRQDYAQLYLYAHSSLTAQTQAQTQKLSTPPNAAELAGEMPATVRLVEKPSPNAPAIEGEVSTGWQHGEWELGRRLVSEAEGGEEVAVREVMLDSMDGGAVENIVLEGGPKWTSQDTSIGNTLQAVDQAVILALCLDVSNTQASECLTQEEMGAYVERVLQQASNWQIRSTALLERSWLEFERRKTADRAMLQIQALIDQHSTKLTITQSTFKSVESAAPVQDRLRYLFSINYLAQYELKRDLAVKYMSCQVFQSALNYFKELCMWDEVVTCYQLLSKPQRAELVVREQLKHGATPYMLTSLADLTGKEELYETAWALSGGRYPRAMRTLGRICFDRGRMDDAIAHLDRALVCRTCAIPSRLHY
jgi:hypothetical protein